MSPNTPQPPAGVLDGFVPFPADRSAAYRAAGYWAGRPLDTILTDAAQQWPDRVAVIDAMSDTGLSYADLDDQANRAVDGLCGAGIAPGDRVLLQLPNGCQFAVALFGLLRAGAIPVMCLPGHRATELGHFAAVSEATGLLIADTAGGFDYRTMAQLGPRGERSRVAVDDDVPERAVPLDEALRHGPVVESACGVGDQQPGGLADRG
ncbi:AMP-binding protein, partial [Mycobacterium sp. 1245499.0]|uniref:AMP-binding protein n=1 Tax=Mycobacterium sp. 1245499.0 TaxID=1834074 RepID=UPI000AE2C188